MSDKSGENPTPPKNFPLIFIVIVVAALVSLGGGATLLWLSQSGSLGTTGGVGPGLLSAKYEPGQAVNIWKHEHWRPGTVKQAGEKGYLVGYEDAPASQDEWVDVSRLQSR